MHDSLSNYHTKNKMNLNKNKKYTSEQTYFVAFFLMIVFILFIRAPEIILKGRFWAEEGTQYFKYAYEHNILETLFWVYFRCGYYYFSANLSVLLAALVPLEFAPFVATFCSFSITIIIVYVIYFTPSYLLTNNFLKILFCFYLVIGPQVVAEVYCNAVNTQVYWGIFGVMALFFDYAELENRNAKGYIPKREMLDVMLVIASLSGLYCVILFPFFIFRFLLQKDKHVFKQITYMTLPFFIQSGLVIYSKFFAGLASTKMNLNLFDFEKIVYSLRQQFIRPLFGIRKTNNISMGGLIFCIAIFIVIYSINLYLYRNNKKLVIQYIMLIVLYAYYFVYVQIGALSTDGAGGRYGFISGSITYLTLLLSIWGIYKKLANWRIILAIVFIPLIVGGYDFQGKANWRYLNYLEAPNWKSEVERFEKDNTYELKCWPYHKEWNLKLIKN